MDFPKSVPGIGLVNDRFVDENPSTGQIGSLIPAAWMNAVTLEMTGLVRRAGLEPDEARNDQLGQAVDELIAAKIDGKFVRALSQGRQLTGADMGLLLLDASAAAGTYTLPASNAELGVRDIIVRRTDNSGNRLVVQASGTNKIKFHPHLRAEGYQFLVLMGAGDYWHLRSDGAGQWWPIARLDPTPCGRITTESSTVVPPGGYGPAWGVLYDRALFPWLYDYAVQTGNIRTDAAWQDGFWGGWSEGDGSTTFRGPEVRSEFVRFLDEGRSVDTERPLGSWAPARTGPHSHDLQIQTPGTAGPYPQWPLGAGGGSSGSYGAAVKNPNNTTYWGNTPLENQLVARDIIDGSTGPDTAPANLAYPGRIKLI